MRAEIRAVCTRAGIVGDMSFCPHQMRRREVRSACFRERRRAPLIVKDANSMNGICIHHMDGVVDVIEAGDVRDEWVLLRLIP